MSLRRNFAFGSRIPHPLFSVARGRPAAQEEVRADFPRIRVDQIAMAGAGLSGSERRHQPKRISGTARRGADPLSRILDKLEACGLIERHPHPSDRRVRILRLAPAGRLKLMQARKLGEIARREALTGLSEAEGLRLLETLKTLKFNLTEACCSSVEKQKRASHG